MSRVLKDVMSINDVDEKEWEEMTDEEREKVAEKEEKEQKLQSMITKGTKIVAPIFLFIPTVFTAVPLSKCAMTPSVKTYPKLIIIWLLFNVNEISVCRLC